MMVQRAVSMNVLSAQQIREFRETVYGFYKGHRRELPWRKTTDPYKILISEVMLQQTHVARVIEKYEGFLRAFPDIKSLARASLRHILTVWQGLGYNRRSLALKRLSEIVVAHHGGEIPSSIEALKALPGIGDATAHAICAFAFNQPTLLIETNIRTVFIHHFFRNEHNVKDTELFPLVAQALDSENPRIWYYALMDYGAALKKKHPNPNRRSAHYQKQGPFEGSNRQIRSAILHVLIKKPRISEEELLEEIGFHTEAVKENLKGLEKEGFVVKKGPYISVA